MTIKIDQKIVSVALAPKAEKEVQKLDEFMKRPEILQGTTYKLKPPVCDSALYITINNIVLNANTDTEVVRPFEIFISSKNMAEYQWVAAFTRLASSVFRKGGDVKFIIEELKSVQDPNGGYYTKRGRMPSVVAEIGCIIEQHFISIGLIKVEAVNEIILAAKAESVKNGSMANAADCAKCNSAKCVILLDGCPTCTSCGDSRCS